MLQTACPYSIALHGGAGAMEPHTLSLAQQQAFLAGLEEALTAGQSVLKQGGTALDAVQASVEKLENNSLFNAGKGSVFTHDGKNEMDAAIMDGSTLQAAAVANVTTIKNPIAAARALLNAQQAVMLVGKGAERFALEQGCAMQKPSYFFSTPRWNDLQKALKDPIQKTFLDHDSQESSIEPSKFGTVGAVALDSTGNLAAATSTGGLTNKKYGRVGDSPIIGAGTYANNHTAAISCTGYGEYFMRLVLSKNLSDRMELLGVNLETAAAQVLEQLTSLGGLGGFVAIDKNNHVVMPFNTKGMYRAFIKSTGEKSVKIF